MTISFRHERSEDEAFLRRLILGAIMYATRRINWYGAKGGEA